MNRTAAAALAVFIAASASARAEESRVGGSVEAYLAWSDVAPPGGGRISLLTTPSQNLLPTIGLALVEGQLATHGFHARLVLGAGESLDRLHDPQPHRSPSGPTALRHLVEASVGYDIPVGRGLRLEAGLFPALGGFERFPTRANWNASHAFLTELAPFYQLGVRLTYPFTDSLSATLMWLSGYAPPEQDTTFRSGGAQLAYRTNRVRGALTLLARPHASSTAPPNDTIRLWADAWAAIQPIPQLEAAAEIVAALDRRPDAAGWNSWAALGAWIRYLPVRYLALSLRADLLDDRDGAVLTAVPQRLTELTFTTSVTLGPALLRAELRIDRSTAPTLDAHDGREILLLSTSAAF